MWQNCHSLSFQNINPIRRQGLYKTKIMKNERIVAGGNMIFPIVRSPLVLILRRAALSVIYYPTNIKCLSKYLMLIRHIRLDTGIFYMLLCIDLLMISFESSYDPFYSYKSLIQFSILEIPFIPVGMYVL